MAFNAGSIDATLTLNRNPFTAGLAAARSQARSFANERYEATLRVKVDDTELNKVKKDTENFAKNSRTATAKVNVDRLMFDKLVKDLREFGRQTYTATVKVNTRDSSSAIRSLIKDLGDGDSTVKRFGNTVDNETNRSNKAFRGMDGTVRAVMMTLPLLLPIAGSAITGLIGLVGALGASLVAAGAGAGAFALVAKPVFDQVKDGASKSYAEIAKLPPGIREAASALKTLTGAYDDLVKRNQASVGAAMAAGFNAATVAVKTLDPVIRAMSAVLVTIGKDMTTYFSSAHWKQFVDFLANNMAPVWLSLWDIIKNMVNAVINLTEAFMPMGQWLLKAIADGMADFAKWTSTLAKDPAFQHWVTLAKDALTKFWDLLVQVVKFIFDLATALTPLGNMILGVLTAVFAGLNKLPPEWLAAIAMGLSGVFAAMMLGGGPGVALAVGAILAVAGAFSSLYDTNEKFRKSINDTVTYLQSKWQPIWDTIVNNFNTKIKPAWDDLVKTVKENFLPVVQDLAAKFDKVLWPILLKIADIITGQLIPNFLELMRVLTPFAAFLTDKVGTVAIKVFELVGNAFVTALKVISDTLALFVDVFSGDWRGAWEDVKRIYDDIMGFLEPEFGTMLDDIKKDFADFIASFKLDWQGWLDTLWGAWSWFSGNMLGGFGNLFTWIEDKIGLEHGTIAQIWSDIWKDTLGTAQVIWDAIKAAWDFFFGDIIANLTKAGSDIKGGWESTWGPIRDFAVGVWNDLKTAWNNFWGANDGIVPVQAAKQEESHQSFLGWIASIVGSLLDFINTVVTSWNNFWDGLSQKFNDWNASTTASWNGFWNGVLSTAVNFISQVVSGWNNFWGTLQQRWNDFSTQVSAAWNGFWANVQQIATDFQTRVRAGFDGFLQGIITAVGNAVVGITNAWHGVANAFRDPINWVINVVINDGLLKAWNTVMGWIGGPTIGGGVPTIPAFAAGGPVRGGTPGRDSVPIMAMPGEFMLSTKAVRNLGGTKAVSQMHAMATGGSIKNMNSTAALPGFADGGPVGGIIGGIMDVLGTFSGIPTSVPGVSGPIGAGINAIPGALIKKVIDAAQGKVSSFLATIAAAIGGGGGSAVASGPIAQIIQQTAAQFGWGSGAQLAALNWIISHESGFNPNAQNPTSTAYGLFQFLNGTWASTGIAKTSDPSLQALAGMRYISSRYGNPLAAQLFWQRNGWYDNGGMLPPGQTMAMNGTGAPEAVLTAPQWDAVMSNRSNDDVLRKLDQLIDVLKEHGTGDTVNINGTNDPVQNAARAVLALKLRRR